MFLCSIFFLLINRNPDLLVCPGVPRMLAHLCLQQKCFHQAAAGQEAETLCDLPAARKELNPASHAGLGVSLILSNIFTLSSDYCT